MTTVDGNLSLMKYSIVLERIEEPGFPDGYYQAYIPRLGLATHGPGLEGARAAARDLVVLWVAEKRAQGEAVPGETDSMFATLDIPDHALQGA
jgi:predicted RNase H-like HicB family nuclease